ncbi:MAG: hypothetical protein PHH47_11135 [Gallionella sp.]|nr:hypothetical protein [Gallionella sp.]MDD4946994.1 hypothetical protein [Gallionella sp.]MDD5612669.1 hypothetical protein [Gallionella sp.]
MTQHDDMQDDFDWYDGLRGKSETGQGALLRRELAALERSGTEQDDLAHDWQRLQFAMRRERVNTGWNFLAMAASVLMFISAISMLAPLGEMPAEDSLMRGASELVVVSADVAQDAGRLQADLVRLGVPVSRQLSTGKISLHIRLAYPVAPAVGELLESNAIALPEQGDLTVTFIQQPQ